MQLEGYITLLNFLDPEVDITDSATYWRRGNDETYRPPGSAFLQDPPGYAVIYSYVGGLILYEKVDLKTVTKFFFLATGSAAFQRQFLNFTTQVMGKLASIETKYAPVGARHELGGDS